MRSASMKLSSDDFGVVDSMLTLLIVPFKHYAEIYLCDIYNDINRWLKFLIMRMEFLQYSKSLCTDTAKSLGAVID